MSLTLEIDRIQPPRYGEIVDDDDEALSLCDLPITRNQDEEKENRTSEDFDFDFDFNFNFNFNSNSGSISRFESEMCAADEVFSGGQILPFRHSVSCYPSRSVSRSGSMDHGRFGSRSSSTSSSSCSSNNTCSSIKTIPMPKPKPKLKVRNNFHSYPSPKPQIQGSSVRQSTCLTPSGKKSTMWEVLRLGLVRSPEIELQDLKVRQRMSNYNKTSVYVGNINQDTKTPTPISGCKIGDLLLELKNNRREDKKGGGIFKSCKCSIEALEPMATRISVNLSTKIASGNQNNKLRQVLNGSNKDYYVAQKKQDDDEQQKSQRLKQLRQTRKHAMSHRTFEWLRDLSQASVLNS